MANELIEAIKARDIEKAKALIEQSENLEALTDEQDEEGNTVLHWAAEKGYTEIITLILGKITGVILFNNEGNTPLHIAAWEGHVDAVTALLESGFFNDELNEKNKFTPLHWAAANNKVEIVALLLDKGANINARNEDQYTPLHEAALAGFTESVRILLAQGANASLKAEEGETALDNARRRDRLDVIPLLEDHTLALNEQLLEAAKAGNDEEVADLLMKGAEVNYQGEIFGDTALLFAVRANNEAVVKHLLTARANVNLSNNGFATPLHAAAEEGNAVIVKLLLEQNADPNLVDAFSNTALQYAAMAGNIDAAKALLNSRYKKVNLNTKNVVNETALDIARRTNNEALVKLLEEKLTDLNQQLLNTAGIGTADEIEILLNQGADVNYKGVRSSTDNSEHQFTALHWAAISGNIDTMTKLLSSGADIEAISHNGMTALYCAIYSSKAAVEYLLSKGAEVNINSFSNRSPLHYAIQLGKSETVELLLQHSANINALDKDGHTPLHTAASFGRLEAAQKLLEKGANIHSKNSKGKTALEIAKSADDSHMSKQQFNEIAELIAKTDKIQKKAKITKGLKLAALISLSTIAAVGLVASIGALAGWGVMVSLLSFAPWLAMAIPAVIAGIVLLSAMTYVGKHLAAARRETIGGDLKHEDRERLLGEPEKVSGGENLEGVLGNGASYTAPIASITPPTSEPSKDTIGANPQ